MRSICMLRAGFAWNRTVFAREAMGEGGKSKSLS